MPSILFQDDYLIAIDKAPGLLVHRTDVDRHERRFAVQLLRDQIGREVHPVHRLDRGASRVLLFALDRHTARAASRLFETQEVENPTWPWCGGGRRTRGRFCIPFPAASTSTTGGVS